MDINNAIGTMEQDTIAAISTSMGEAGIGIVRISGKDAFSIAEAVFVPAVGKEYEKKYNKKLRYGWIKDGNETIDEVLVSFMEKPHTYTAEDVIEINAHGGAVSVKRILDLILSKGARLAEKGEFTKRAFLNGRMDLTQAEAVIDVIDAKTTTAHEQAVKQLGGSISNEIGELKIKMLEILSHIEYSINFMEDAEEDLPIEPVVEKIENLLEEIQKLLVTSEQGRIIREGIRTVIVGKPNVGKSSLLNALLKYSRAIVTDIPGTTRDSIEESYNLNGIQLRLFDTAGIRETEDVVEALGVDRSRSLMKKADLVLAIVDGSNEISDEDRELFEEAADRPIIFLKNKIDLGVSKSVEDFQKEIEKKYSDMKWVSISAKNGGGIDDLQRTIMDYFFKNSISHDDGLVITNMRHKKLLENAENDLKQSLGGIKNGFTLDAIEVDCRAAYKKLCEITGEAMDDDVLNRIFQSFCIGK